MVLKHDADVSRNKINNYREQQRLMQYTEEEMGNRYSAK